jgi:hypothetical protein
MRYRLTTLLATVLVVFGLTGAVDSRADPTSVPLCTADSPDCVIGNWGQTEPDGLDANAVTKGAASLTSAQGRISIRPMPVAATADPMKKAAPSVKAVTSPVNFAPKETAALIAAIKRARFTKDGAFVSGDKQIASAAEAAAKKAGKTYTLTLYVKAPPTLKPDAAQSLTERVKAVNGVLTGTVDKPRS